MNDKDYTLKEITMDEFNRSQDLTSTLSGTRPSLDQVLKTLDQAIELNTDREAMLCRIELAFKGHIMRQGPLVRNIQKQLAAINDSAKEVVIDVHQLKKRG
jgi:hypothetical protein